MSKPRAIRNRKSEMISCWVCAAFIAILFIGKNLLIGSGSMGVFNTALISNVKIVERHQHSQRVSYVPLGRDAAISGNVQNFRWKNNTKYAIKIKMTVKGGKITCTFYTCQKAKPKKVKLKVTQKGKTFTLKRSVKGKSNYSCKSKY